MEVLKVPTEILKNQLSGGDWMSILEDYNQVD